MSESLPTPLRNALPIVWLNDGFAARFEEDTSDAEKVEAITSVAGAMERLPLAFGDLINQTIDPWVEDVGMQRGDAFDQLAHATGYSAGYLRNQAETAKHIPAARRRAGISPTLYQEIADFKEPEAQEYWMDRVLGENMTRASLRAAKREEAEEQAKVMPTTDGKEPITMTECPTCHSIVPETALHGEE